VERRRDIEDQRRVGHAIACRMMVVSSGRASARPWEQGTDWPRRSVAQPAVLWFPSIPRRGEALPA
jgi:hypothetical protein